MRARLFSAAIATALALLGPAAGAAAQAPDGDSVSGEASQSLVGFTILTVDARSGPSGENPTGTASWTVCAFPGCLGDSGSITCLAVDGNVAIVGFRRDAFTQSVARVLDGGPGPGDDSYSVVTYLSRFELPAPDCSSFPPQPPQLSAFKFTAGGRNETGDLVVHDAIADLVPPVLTVPSGITVNATGPSGARVTYSASATDNVDPHPSVNCSPPSGSTFRIGTTTVTCTATDQAGNTATKTFRVVVKGAVEQITDLTALVRSLGLAHGTTASFVAQLEGARTALAAGERRDACGSLKAFVNHANAQSGKKLTVAQANRLIGDATRIGAVLSCG